MIDIQAVSKSFGTVEAVKNLTLTVPDGAITTLLGANGSGKTTTLRMIAGLLKPDTGDITIDGKRVSSNRAAAVSTLGFFPDRFGLYPRLTAREQITYAARLRGIDEAQLHNAVGDAMETLAIGALAERRSKGFSAGQRVKVALAATIVGRPKTMIFDEPTRALDLYAVKLLRIVLKSLKKDGHAILLASHVMADVEELSDTVVVMAGGKIVAQGSCDDIRKQAKQSNLEDAFFALSGFDLEAIK